MTKLQRTLVLALLAAVLVACTGDGDKPYTPEPGSGSEPEPEPVDAADVPVEPESDAGPEGTAPVPLTVWVDDLIDHRTNDDAPADTVLDKMIIDDTDPTSFDKYLR
jgi:hypothetical protein